MLAALTDAKTVAVYTLARALSTFAGVPADGVAAAFFPRMAIRSGLPGAGCAWWSGSASRRRSHSPSLPSGLPQVFSSAYRSCRFTC